MADEPTADQKAALTELVSQYGLDESQLAPSPEPRLPAPAEGDVPPIQSALPPRGEDGKFLPKPKPPEHSALTIHRAKEAGLTDDLINGASPEELREYILEQRLASQERQFHKQADTNVSAPTAIPVAEAVPEIDVSDFDDRLIKYIDRKVAMALARVEQMERSRVEESQTQRLDRAFDDLPEELHGFLGKGPASSFGPDSPQVRYRLGLIAEARQLAGAKADVEAVVRKLKEAAEKSFAKLLTKKPATPPRGKPTTYEVDEWNESGLAQPTHRTNANEPLGTETAKRELTQYMRENGRGQFANQGGTNFEELGYPK